VPFSLALRSEDRSRPQLARPWRWRLQSQNLLAFGLIAAGALPPFGLAVLPGGLTLLAAPRTGIVVVAALIFAPAVVVAAAALQGFDSMLSRLRAEAEGAYRQTVGRVLLGGLVFVWVFGFLAAAPADPAIAPCLLIASLNLGAAWLFLLYLMLDPARAALLRHVALISDLTLLSLLLAVGGSRTAALAPAYLYIAIAYADQQGPRAAAGIIALSAAAFAVVVAATPFWRGQLALAFAMLVAMILLPAYIGARLRDLGARRIEAEAANAAKDGFLGSLGEDLRGTLRAIAHAGSDIDRDAVDAQSWSAIAETRLNARTMLLQLDDALGYVKLDAGALSPETRTFDLYRLANGAVAALRAAASECGVLLDLRIDPLLPYQLYGWPHQLRQVLIGLAANVLRHAGKTKVRIDLGAVELAGQGVILRVSASTGIADDQLETVEEAAAFDAARRPLGLVVVERTVELMGGRLFVDAGPGRGMSLTAELPFAIDQASAARPLDLAALPVLIVTRDLRLVDDLFAPLEAWRADPRWIGAEDAALEYLDAFEHGARRALLIVDGRGDVLRTLSWAHRAAALCTPDPPYILFIADEPRIDSIIGLAGGEFDVILPAPLTPDVLRSALHSLTIEPASELLAALPPPARSMRRPAVTEAPAETAADFAPLEASSPQREEPANRPWQVLIATENVSNRRIMGSLLSRAGHAVHLAATADEARKKLEAQEIDVLLLDLIGAHGTDYEAARLCRRVRPSATIIALTTDGPAEAERQASEIGLDAILRKPVRTRPLLAAIEAAMAGKAPEPTAPSVVTSLSSHPRFAADANPPATERPVGIKPVRQTSTFFSGVIDTFRGDCHRVIADLGQAASVGDTQAFEAALQALRDSTANFGASRLRELTQSMRDLSPVALRQQGADYVRRLDAELRRLDAALAERLRTAN
jgi:signal transduction histidine kinase/DNA-binding response OmpR family regulator